MTVTHFVLCLILKCASVNALKQYKTAKKWMGVNGIFYALYLLSIVINKWFWEYAYRIYICIGCLNISGFCYKISFLLTEVIFTMILFAVPLLLEVLVHLNLNLLVSLGFFFYLNFFFQTLVGSSMFMFSLH